MQQQRIIELLHLLKIKYKGGKFMPSSLIVPQTLVNSGLLATYESANILGNFYANTGQEIMIIKNGSASPTTVTVDSVALDNFGNASHDVVYTLLAGAEMVIGKLSKRRFNDTNGYVQVSYSAVTTITVAVVKVVYQI
jgi:hypothetical protein